jgi:hypothetical protein
VLLFGRMGEWKFVLMTRAIELLRRLLHGIQKVSVSWEMLQKIKLPPIQSTPFLTLRDSSVESFLIRRCKGMPSCCLLKVCSGYIIIPLLICYAVKQVTGDKPAVEVSINGKLNSFSPEEISASVMITYIHIVFYDLLTLSPADSSENERDR